MKALLGALVLGTLLAGCATSPTGRSQLMLISPEAAIVESRKAYLTTVGQLDREDKLVDDPRLAARFASQAEVLTYESIADHVESNVVPFPEGEEAAAPTSATLTVTQVRVRGHKGEVDAVRAQAGGPEQLVTVYTAWDAFGGWRVTRIRPWRMPVPDKPL